jgi:hypothetical protein
MERARESARVAFDPLLYLSALLIAAVLALVLVVRRYNDKVSDLREELKRLSSSKQSLATTYGRITEQWAPFMADYPYDPRNFRFLGSPIDGVQFEEDKVVFVEFKTNGSRLSPTQERIRALVKEGKVEWLEFRLAHTDASPARAGFTGTGAQRD